MASSATTTFWINLDAFNSNISTKLMTWHVLLFSLYRAKIKWKWKITFGATSSLFNFL